jgi:hypothetical protein
MPYRTPDEPRARDMYRLGRKDMANKVLEWIKKEKKFPHSVDFWMSIDELLMMMTEES